MADLEGYRSPGCARHGTEFTAVDALEALRPSARPLPVLRRPSVIGRLPRRRVPPRRGLGPCRRAMAHHPDAARRIGLAVVDALAELHRSIRTRSACDLGRPGASSSARSAAGRSAGRSSTPAGSRRCPTSGACRAMPPVAARVRAAQRLQDRQLPVRPGGPRPGEVDLRLGHGHAGRAAGRPRHAAQLLAGSRRRRGRPAAARGRPRAPRPAVTGRGRRALRRPTGFDVAEIAWYEAFATWKTCVVLEQPTSASSAGEHRSADGRGEDPRRSHPRRPGARLSTLTSPP